LFFKTDSRADGVNKDPGPLKVNPKASPSPSPKRKITIWIS